MSEGVLTQLCAELRAAHDEASISRAADAFREYLHRQELQVKASKPTFKPGEMIPWSRRHRPEGRWKPSR